MRWREGLPYGLPDSPPDSRRSSVISPPLLDLAVDATPNDHAIYEWSSQVGLRQTRISIPAVKRALTSPLTLASSDAKSSRRSSAPALSMMPFERSDQAAVEGYDSGDDDDGALSIEPDFEKDRPLNDTHSSTSVSQDERVIRDASEDDFECWMEDDDDDARDEHTKIEEDDTRHASYNETGRGQWDMPYTESPNEEKLSFSVPLDTRVVDVENVQPSLSADVVSFDETRSIHNGGSAEVQELQELIIETIQAPASASRASSLPVVHTGRRMSDAANGRFSVTHAQIVKRSSSLADVHEERGRVRCPVQVFEKSSLAPPHMTICTVNVLEPCQLDTVFEGGIDSESMTNLRVLTIPRRRYSNASSHYSSTAITDSCTTPGLSIPSRRNTLSSSRRPSGPDGQSQASQKSSPLIEHLKTKLAELSSETDHITALPPASQPHWLPLLEPDRDKLPRHIADTLTVPPNTRKQSCNTTQSSSSEADEEETGALPVLEHSSTNSDDHPAWTTNTVRFASASHHIPPQIPFRRHSLHSTKKHGTSSVLQSGDLDLARLRLQALLMKESLPADRAQIIAHSVDFPASTSPPPSQLGMASRDSFLLTRERLRKATRRSQVPNVRGIEASRLCKQQLPAVIDASPPAGDERTFEFESAGSSGAEINTGVDDKTGCCVGACAVHCPCE